MKYFIIAGEASGDLHGSNLIRGLRQWDPQAEIQCWGGDKMEAAGAALLKHYRELAFMGFGEVLRHLPVILQNFRLIKRQILRFQPDVVIPIDYPGFNMRLLPFFKKNSYPVTWYISPQLWAWNVSRAKTLGKYVDLLIVILPFEPAFFEKFGIRAYFAGHPLLDALPEGLEEKPISGREKTIALLPGSRKQEVQTMLPVMLETVKKFPDYEPVIAAAPSLDASFYEQICHHNPVRVVFNETYFLLKKSAAALVSSGTATLETALLGTPQVVCYKGSWLSYQIGRRLVKVNYISLVNLILNKPVVPELIQEKMTPENMAEHLRQILYTKAGDNQLSEYGHLRKMLGQPGSSLRAAKLIVEQFAPDKA